MPIQFWQCCGRYMAPKARCTECGKTRPAVGFVDQSKKSANAHKNENNRKLSKLKEVPGQFFISTFKKVDDASPNK